MSTRTFKQHVITWMISQFGRPRGAAGRLAGWIMAGSDSNRRRNRWVASLLDVGPQERVLEIGFGPGLAIAELAGRAGHVYGVDHSEVMVRQARRHNAAAVRAGRVELLQASVDRLPSFGEPLDAVLTVNSVKFWPDPALRIGELRGLLRPGGRIALVNQPRGAGANAEAASAQAAREFQDLLTDAGFTGVRVKTLPLDPPVACVLATNPEVSGSGTR
jgi:SAM-dependent methyltransferase